VRRRRSRRAPGAPPWAWTAAAAAAVLAAGAVWLSFQAERKLSSLVLGGLGEGFSTKVWSAPFVIESGRRAEAERLVERLDRLGYRRVPGRPATGEYRWEPPALEVGLRGHSTPVSSQAGGLFVLRRTGAGAWDLFDADGAPADELRLEPELVGELSGGRGQRREPVTWEQLPRRLVDAVVAVEDKRFWSHHGLDPRAVVRAAWSNLRGRELQGASTITQQLSKNLFLSPRRTFTRKAAEAALAVYLELRLDKTRILTLYLNHIYLGQDGSSSVMGARAASRHYFAKEPADLTLPEAATLAGLIRGPGLYNPFRDPAAARARRDHVLRRMREDGLIGEAERAEAAAAPLELVRGAGEEDRRDAAYFTAEVVRQLLPRYGGDALYRHGLSIHTTLDPVLQARAQAALRGARHQAALAAVDPRDGSVLALSGGRDYGSSQFNRATQAARQPGSAFKPFVFAAALGMGLTPATILRDKPKTWSGGGRDWSPANYDGVYHGTATVRRALALSLNAASLDLAERAGLRRVVETARACGVVSPLREDLGLALGASEVGLLELTAAYAPFANGGRRVTPRLVTAVLDAEGRTLEAPAPEAFPALDPETAYLTASLLESVAREGTARSLKALGVSFPVAGKTGTTDKGRDAWFVGFDSELVAGVWTGADDNRALKLTGAKDALPLWAEFIRESSADRAPREFDRPAGVVERAVCPDSGMLARSGCPRKLAELFRAGTEPSRDCALHRGGLLGWFDRLVR
jgi:penicillin-binding protein 1B